MKKILFICFAPVVAITVFAIIAKQFEDNTERNKCTEKGGVTIVDTATSRLVCVKELK